MNKIGVGVLGLVGTGLAMAAAPEPRLQLSTGLDYSNGNYGQAASTEVLVVPFSARVSWGAWSVRASAPYVNVSGPADVSVILDDRGGGNNSGSGSSNSGSGGSGSDDGDGSGAAGSAPFGANRSVSGLGDASLSLTYSLDAIGRSPLYADLTARVKFATGSERLGLGSGAIDYFSTGELGWDIGGGGVFVNGGRRFLGSSVVRRVDGWQWGAGGWLVVNPALELGLDYTGRQAAVAAGRNIGAVEGSATLRLSDAWKVVAYGGAGLTTASADYTGGLTLIWHAGRRRR